MAPRYAKSFNVVELSDAELLAVHLRASEGRSANDRATALLSEAGSLSSVLYRTRDNDIAKPYLNVRETKQIQAGMEIGRRVAFDSLAGTDVMNSPQMVREFLALQLANREYEVFCALFLDNRHRVIEFRELFRGTIDSAAVYPREVVKQCLGCNAAAVIFAHNHPSKVAEPSDTDVRLTRKLVDALALVDVRVLDHLILGGSNVTSLAERGLM